MTSIKNNYLVIICLSLFSVILYAEPFAIHEFSEEGKTTGYLYAEFTKDNLLKSAQIKLDGKVLYTISCDGFYAEDKLQLPSSCDAFNGFVIVLLNDHEIVVNMADKEGQSFSDNATVYWDKVSKTFTTYMLP